MGVVHGFGDEWKSVFFNLFYARHERFKKPVKKFSTTFFFLRLIFAYVSKDVNEIIKFSFVAKFFFCLDPNGCG